MRFQQESAGGGDETALVKHDYTLVHFVVSFKRICTLAIACPVGAILVCLLTAILFQADDVHETHCRVYNIIPSISAITGISPQRYLWRISVALHIGPRLIIATLYRAYYENIIANASATLQLAADSAQRWLKLAFWLHIVEIGALCGVTFISNRENYPIHEKLFITFMISSLTHMLANIKVTRKIAEIQDEVDAKQKILQIKQRLFILSLTSTIGLVAFFLQHRFLCHNMAFSWFAFCEYVIASANMAFHLAAVVDFPTEQIIVARCAIGQQTRARDGGGGGDPSKSSKTE